MVVVIIRSPDNENELCPQGNSCADASCGYLHLTPFCSKNNSCTNPRCPHRHSHSFCHRARDCDINNCPYRHLTPWCKFESQYARSGRVSLCRNREGSCNFRHHSAASLASARADAERQQEEYLKTQVRRQAQQRAYEERKEQKRREYRESMSDRYGPDWETNGKKERAQQDVAEREAKAAAASYALRKAKWSSAARSSSAGPPRGDWCTVCGRYHSPPVCDCDPNGRFS